MEPLGFNSKTMQCALFQSVSLTNTVFRAKYASAVTFFVLRTKKHNSLRLFPWLLKYVFFGYDT